MPKQVKKQIQKEVKEVKDGSERSSGPLDRQEQIQEPEIQQDQTKNIITEKTYTYDKTNKDGTKTKKIVKRKYNVTTTNARNPEIKQRIIDVIKQHKDELLKESDTKVCSKIKELLNKEQLPGSYNFIRKHWNQISSSAAGSETAKTETLETTPLKMAEASERSRIIEANTETLESMIETNTETLKMLNDVNEMCLRAAEYYEAQD